MEKGEKRRKEEKRGGSGDSKESGNGSRHSDREEEGVKEPEYQKGSGNIPLRCIAA